MEPYEKLALKSWGFQYAPETMAVLREHYAEVFDRWKSQAFTVSNEYLEERLNIEYMNQAQNPDLDKYRIPLAAAKKLLLYVHTVTAPGQKRYLPSQRLLPDSGMNITGNLPLHRRTWVRWTSFVTVRWKGLWGADRRKTK